ncbi:MAG TPA: hypothetical protein VF832_19675 [Longimicrobiales bacterium]
MASQLVEALFPAPAYRRTTFGLLTWWESRRLLYNGIVGVSGLASLVVVEMFMWLPPGPHHYLPLRAPIFFGMAANVCYTLGWVVESAMERLWGREAPLIGPALFRQGLAFSVGLTWLPAAVSVVDWTVRLAKALAVL